MLDTPNSAAGQQMPRDEDELDAHLSEPTPCVVEALTSLHGDLVILGAGGKIGPSLARMAARALAASGSAASVYAVSRWADERARLVAERAGVRTVAADLSDPESYGALPDAGAVVFLTGQKFGTNGNESGTWWSNAAIPTFTAGRYRRVPTVVYSTGNVYPLRPLTAGGSTEHDPVGPIGQYAQSCLAREQLFSHAAVRWQTPICIYRLNYAIELRYGVIADIGVKILSGEEIDVTMPAVNVVWQRDSNVWTLRALALCSTPPRVLNATGPETISVRQIATILGRVLDTPVRFRGQEADDALLNDASECHALFGYPSVTVLQAIDWVAQWLLQGGRQLAKATKFAQRDGTY